MKISITKPVFTVKYSDEYQIIATVNFRRFLYFALRTLFTGHKYLEKVDNSCKIFSRPTVCTTIINESVELIPDQSYFTDKHSLRTSNSFTSKPEDMKIKTGGTVYKEIDLCPTDVFQGIKCINPLDERFGKYISEFTTATFTGVVINASELPLKDSKENTI